MVNATGRSARRAVGIAIASVWLCTFAAETTAQPVFHYQATVFDGQVDRSGAVNASGLVWQCQANRCTISGPWPRPGVSACANLARAVGRISSYGHPGAMLNATELAQCNANMPRDGAVAVPVNPSGPVIVANPVATPVVPNVPVAQPIVVVRANDSLRYTGHRHLSARSAPLPTLIFTR
jgi:hypothetical protein